VSEFREIVSWSIEDIYAKGLLPIKEDAMKMFRLTLTTVEIVTLECTTMKEAVQRAQAIRGERTQSSR
jgi:hypothetical protein